MKKLRIGYQALSADLSHPGDRRRVVFWAKRRGHEIVTDLSGPLDAILLSERADFGIYPRKAAGVPVIFDLVDAYLASESTLHDWTRGASKVFAGQLTGIPKPFTHFVQDLCSHASAVVCSSPEQRELITPYAKNVHVILDSHDELPTLPFGYDLGDTNVAPRILWEGMPATLGGVEQFAHAIQKSHLKNSIHMDFVTNTEYFRLLGRYFSSDTSSLLRRSLGQLYSRAAIVPWSLDNLVGTAKLSSLAVIPIQLTNPLQYLKPENRLLIMWRLGLPCLTSASPAYKRVTHQAGLDTVCDSEADWAGKSIQIIDNPDFAREIVGKGQAYLQANHTSEILLKKWDRAFESVL